MQGRRALFVVVLSALLALAAVAPAGAPAARGCRYQGRPAADLTVRQARSAVLCLLNRERVRHGLGRLRSNRALRVAAQRHSADMVRRTFFEHVTPGGRKLSDRLSLTKYVKSTISWVVGENIAWGTADRSTPLAIHHAWMNSPGHRRNILDGDFHEVGVGFVRGIPVEGHDGVVGGTYTTDFGARD